MGQFFFERNAVIEECARALEEETFGAGFARHIRSLKEKPERHFWCGRDIAFTFALGVFAGFFALMIFDKWYL